ncbi:MAG: prepilin-type N-terminal cleavage/methylation domain-containing protein [Candidatus Gracilibacteria bacterium]|nr:prepilin-type N-terminal cleavage/methylation domain-containing protein [Candidatus Gracilibacteria bacterium]
MQTNGTSPLPKTPSKKSRIHNYHGFTLVELIVVITILVILGTIAFMSLSGYSGNARDSSRVSDLTNLSKGLDIASIKTGSYPTPDNPFTITYSGGVIWTQGTIGDSVINTLSSVGAKMNKKPTDPLITSKEYTYSKLAYGNAYQIKTDWEGDSIAYRNDIIDQANAASGNPTLSYIKGNYNGVVAKTQTGTTTCILALPSIIVNTGTVNQNIALETNNLLSGSLLIHKGKLSGTPFKPSLTETNNPIVYCSGSLPSTTTEQRTFATNIANAYSGTALATNPSIQPFISALSDVNSGTLLASLGGGLLNAILGGNTINSAGTSTGVVQAPPVYDTGTFQFLGFDTDLDRVFAPSGTYASGWTSNACDMNTIPVYSVLNPGKFFGTGVVLASNTIYKIPNGTYNLTGSTLSNGHIKLGNCTGIIGASKAGVVFNANFSGGNTSETGALFLMDGKSNDIISSITVNGNKAGTYKYKDGIIASGSTNSTLDNLLVYGAQNQGVILKFNASNNIIRNIDSNNNGSYGVILHSNSNYNKLSGITTYANSSGLMIQVNSSYNTAQNIRSYQNTNYGLFVYSGSNSNTINQYIGYNQTAGLVMQLNSNDNRFTDMSINGNSWVGVYIDSVSGSIFNNFEVYNNLSMYGEGIFLTGSTMNYFNNFHTYNNTERGIDMRYSSKNSFNNFLAYNNAGISVEVEYGDSNYFNKVYTFNNIIGATESPISLRFYLTSLGYIKDYYSYNNQNYGCIEVGASNTTRTGVYKIFGIANYDTTGCGASPTGNDGTVMNCSWHVQPAWMGSNLGASCTTGYYTNSYIGTTRATYTFGSNIGNQIQPKRWNGASFADYGADGTDYDSTKKVGQW